MNAKLTIFFLLFFLLRIGIINSNNLSQQDSCLCNIQNLVKIHESIDDLTKNEISDFLWTFDGRCKNNAEYSEFSHEILYDLLCSKKAHLLIRILSENDNFPIRNLMLVIENPINDLIDLDKAYNNIKTIDTHKDIRNAILRSIDIARSKYTSSRQEKSLSY